ncbi:MAG TPA: NmrA/HSCARG family protein [Flavitalea sp.]|nr:NmrA/HSCARG family protein [Flavitalea sp.]
MDNKKIIVVFGATGAQGGGLAHAILDDPKSEFAVRAITRDQNSEKAKQLAEKGAEVISADIDDKESMRKALEGAYGAYFVTFFWSHLDAGRETAEAKNMAAAAKEAGLKHAIWSTLDDARNFVPLDDDSMPTLQGKYKVPHFDGKGESDKFFAEAGVPVTNLLTSFYWDNLIYFGMGPKKGEDGNLVFTLPMADKKLAAIAAEDIGKCAYGIFKDPKRFIGKTVGIAGEQLSGKEISEKLSKALKKEVKFNAITPAQFRGFGFPAADDLGNMFQFYSDFEDHFNKSRDVNLSKELNPELMSFDMWVNKYADRIPVE